MVKVVEYHKKQVNKKSKPEVEEMIKKMRKEDEKMVKGHFEFVEAEGGFFKFSHRTYPGEPISVIELLHGEICEIPMGLVRLLNNTKKKISRYADAELRDGKSLRTYETISRVRFIPSAYT
jgi:hypothetical protein